MWNTADKLLDAETEGASKGRGMPCSAGKPTEQAQWETCEIHDMEGLYGDDIRIRCHRFLAQATGPRGTYTAGASRGFYCPDWDPEPEYAGNQLEALVGQLVREGWELAELPRTEWWRLRFRRRIRAGRPATP